MSKRGLRAARGRPAIETKDIALPDRQSAFVAIKSEFVPQELLVRFKKAASHESRKRLFSRAGVKEKGRAARSGHTVLRLPKGWSVSGAQAWFAEHEMVDLAEPNFIYETQETPDDERFADQWALPHIAADPAWNFETGNPDIVIAVIDTGVDYLHADLAANLWRNPAELPDDGLDNDGNGYIDDDIGWDFVRGGADCVDEDCGVPDRDPMDGQGHGTHVAGIAAAVTDNRIGIAGVARECRFMAVRVGYKNSTGSGVIQLSDAIDGIHYAVDNGAKILNLSWGSANASHLLQEAIRYATARGAIVCAAAGNGSTGTYFYPAAYDGPLVLAVGATDQEDDKAGYSNFGDWVDVSAPGSSILSTCLNNSYCSKSGTSMAAPHVAGMAGLLFSRFPGWSTQVMATVLLNSVVILADLEGMNAASGLINLELAMEIDGSDLARLTERIAQSYGTVGCADPGGCDGDIDGDQDVDGVDINLLLSL